MMGTPYYMSPEQVIGAKGIDHRTDVWALGIVAFECLTGQKPFDAETIGGLAVSICSGLMPIPSVMNARLGVDVDRWFARACARDVAVRFSSAKEMADALNALAGGRPTEPRLSQFEESGGYPAASHPGFLPGVTPQGGVPSAGTPSALAPVRAPWDPAPVTAPVVGLGALQRTTPIPLNAAAASALARSVVEPVGKLGKLGMTTQAPVTDGEIQPAGIPSRGGTGAILALVAIAALVVVGIGVKLATRPTDAQVTTATQPTEPAAPTASTPAANASSPTVPSPAASGVSSKASVPSAPTSASVAAQKAPVAAGATSTTSTPRSSRPSIAAPMPAASPKPPPTKSKDRDSIE
jgi:serine/threonine-protein kinase